MQLSELVHQADRELQMDAMVQKWRSNEVWPKAKNSKNLVSTLAYSGEYLWLLLSAIQISAVGLGLIFLSGKRPRSGA